MSQTLSSKASELKARIESLHGLRANMAEASELEGLRAQLAPMTTKYLANLDRLRLLSQSGLKVVEPVGVARLRKRARSLLVAFEGNPKASTLKSGQLWVSLISEGDNATKELLATAKERWLSHRVNIFGGETTEALDAKLAKTKSNQSALRDYRETYNAFKSQFDSAPSTVETIQRAKDLASKLEIISQRFDYFVSPDVKAFLEAVQSVRGARISLLTEEVIVWLRENNSIDSYCIKTADYS